MSSKNLGRKLKPANKGFSLVEMMLVLGIMGVMAGMGAYTFSHRKSTQIAVMRADLLDALQEARGLASQRSECVRVRLENNSFAAETFAAGAGRRCNGPFGTALRTLTPIDFGARKAEITAFSDNNNVIVFNTNGGVADDRAVTFELRLGTEVARFRILPAIGQIRAQ